MAAARLRRVDGAGNRHHVLALFAGQARGDQRARLQRRFHHQGGAGQASDQAVATRKIERQRRRTERKFTEQQAPFGNALRQHLMPARVADVEPRAHHRGRDQAA